MGQRGRRRLGLHQPDQLGAYELALETPAPPPGVLARSRIALALRPGPAGERDAPDGEALPFLMQRQLQTNWCWSATSVSVADHYVDASGWTQCRMADAELARTSCCRDGSSAACNQPNVLDSPLDRAGVLRRMLGGTIGFDAIRAEIDAGRPVAWRIGWSGGGGHFAVIAAYEGSDRPWVGVHDPWFGASVVSLSALTGGTYEGTGTWTHTYLTRRPPPG